MPLIDIHAHILPGLDDGAKSVEESVEMLRLATAGGTEAIVATPHANSRYPYDPGLVEERLAELRPLSPIPIHRGCDLRLQYDLIEDALEHPAKYTIDGKGYLLVEFPDLALFAQTDEILQGLLDARIVPIVTHPERHRELSRRPDDLARWVRMGCLVQVTAGSCTGRFGRAASGCVSALMARGLVHVVASDAHDLHRRPPPLREAYEALSADWGEEAVRPLFSDHPRAVVEGAAMEVEARPVRRRTRKWYQFWG